jgi:two-component system, chemotaxis family, protein-glutamate methylesterase/glutaminase
MTKIRVLIVDDAVVVRRMLTDVLAGDPSVEVAGTAANGRIALAKIPQINPDIVTLDVEMPEMNGLETLVEIRKRYPHLPVIMVSSVTHRGAMNTMEALSHGANDYVTKPAGLGSVAEATQYLREQLIPKVKLWCTRSPRGDPAVRAPGATSSYPVAARTGRSHSASVQAVAIGVSTGGPNALSTVLGQLPGTLAVPVFVVQHMPPVFTKLLAERLASKSALRVTEAADGDEIRAQHVYLAPGNYHMSVGSNGGAKVIRTTQEPQENSCRPAVDVLFRSIADTYGAGSLGIILTGMGQDGLRGCERMRETGGQILAQDEASSVVWGMPGFVARAGLADKVVPLDEVASEIVRRVEVGRMGPARRTAALV